MLAPVLARLDAIPGVRESRVDSSGQFFALALAAGADPSRVAASAREVLGAGAALLSAGEAGDQLAARGRGDPWLAAGEVMTLSYVEARLLAVRLGEALDAAGALGAEHRERLCEALRAALAAAMEHVHAEGGASSSGWIHARWPAIARAAARRCEPWLPAAVRAALEAPLRELLASR